MKRQQGNPVRRSKLHDLLRISKEHEASSGLLPTVVYRQPRKESASEKRNSDNANHGNESNSTSRELKSLFSMLSSCFNILIFNRPLGRQALDHQLVPVLIHLHLEGYQFRYR